MPGRQEQMSARIAGPGRTRVMVEGVAALVALAALSASLFGIVTWAIVQLVRMLAA